MPKPGIPPARQKADTFVRLYEQQLKIKERSPEPTILSASAWTDSGAGLERRRVIVYPRDSRFIIDRLDSKDGWVEVTPRKEQDTLERATAQAQSLANTTGVPHSVREVIDD